MTLKLISIRNLLRRKGKAAFILAGLVIGVATVVGIISFVDATKLMMPTTNSNNTGPTS